jgi:cytoskeleton protein RodZ
VFEIGASLREARTNRNLSADDVQKGIHIRTRYLMALEEERWELLPGEAYAKGFLRTYAEFLGLNSDVYIDEYEARVAARVEEPFVPDSLAPRGHNRLLFRSIVGTVGLVALAVAVSAWNLGSAKASHPTAEVTSPMPNHQPVRVSPAASAVKPVVVPARSIVVIRAARDRCWLSIHIGGPAGREIFRGILERGRRLRYPLATKLWVRMGRPLALDIRIDGQAASGLQRSASNLVLTKTGPLAG